MANRMSRQRKHQIEKRKPNAKESKPSWAIGLVVALVALGGIALLFVPPDAFRSKNGADASAHPAAAPVPTAATPPQGPLPTNALASSQGSSPDSLTEPEKAALH